MAVKKSFYISKITKTKIYIVLTYELSMYSLFVNEGKKSFQISKVDYCSTSQKNSLPSVAFPDGGHALETLRGYNFTLNHTLFCILILVSPLFGYSRSLKIGFKNRKRLQETIVFGIFL